MIFWKALRLSPALLGASLVFASSTYAGEIVRDQTAATSTNQAAAQEKPAVAPLAELSQTQVVASNTNSVQSVPHPTAVNNTNPQVAAQEKSTVDPLAGNSQIQAAAQEKPTVDPLTGMSQTQAAAQEKPTVDPLTGMSQTKVEEPSVAQLTPSNSSSPSVNQADNTLAQQAPAAGNTTNNSSEVLQQINRYTNDTDTQDQVTNVTQLRDVSPNDWAYEALRSLVERYGCIAGYPDGTYRGNRAMSRYEFAAGLNACLQQVERLIASNTADFVRKEDLATLQRLIDEFRTELTTLGTRVDKLEGRVGFLEAHQFSTTTKLVGEVIFNVADLFGNEDRLGNNYVRGETVFDYRVRLNFDTSFTGKDLLRTRLQAGNITEFGPLTGPTTPGGNITREGRFGFQADTGSNVELDRLFYRFPVGDIATAYLFANRGQYEDFVAVLNPGFDSSGTGALSRFGRFSPIYRMGGQGTGAGLVFGAKSPLRLDLGYLTDEGPNPSEGAGLFDGNYSALAQLTFKPIKQLSVAATYVNSYDSNNLRHGTGSRAAQVSGRPVVGQSYGVEASLAFTPRLVLSGWGAYTKAIILETGQADVWTYGATLSINDIGPKGSSLGFVVGMEPKLTGSDRTLGNIPGLDAGERRDEDTGLHVEGFYKLRLSKNILITPGVIWLTAPGHNEDNDDIIIGTIRTTFTF